MGNFIVFMVSIFSIALVALILLYAYISRLRKGVYEKWDALLSSLRRRLDMMPLLIEIVKKNTDESAHNLLQEVISLRSDVWPVTICDKNHVESEFEVSDKIKALFALSKDVQDLNHDTDFLSLKNDFNEIAEKIESLTGAYNDGVRSFNGNILFKSLLPLFRIFGFNKLLIFEFEN